MKCYFFREVKAIKLSFPNYDFDDLLKKINMYLTRIPGAP